MILVDQQFPSCSHFVSVDCKEISMEEKNNLANNYVENNYTNITYWALNWEFSLVSLHFALHQFKVSYFEVHMWRFLSPKILIALYIKSFWHWNTLLASLQNPLPENTQKCHRLFALKWILSFSTHENNPQSQGIWFVWSFVQKTFLVGKSTILAWQLSELHFLCFGKERH